ncbi:acyl-CoA dehydrogenase [Sphingomonas sp. CL5.1]|uniref:acyl-CoA dehydrogenase family protein n=1 Tax=Sphingomonas sp. CL5.1 TaxID=2653203 RepID=UPI00158241D2|nr:acyl-CoA dehydrogenase family protein [Sphingomonas sp. CL5.1]QKR98840.1 acyl-CoA dehydrogenase [Sphingomonas sp. CL5.1]
MTLALTEEQTMIRDAAAGWAAERAPTTALRALRKEALAATGHDPALYAEMAEMGWTGVTIPEAEGGFGMGFAAAGLIAEQLGRTLVASPLIGSAVVAGAILVMAGSAEQKAAWLPRIIAGDAVVALALDEGPRHDPTRLAFDARCEGADWVLDGVKRPVFDGTAADAFIVATRTPGGLSLFLCPADGPGVSRAALRQIDSRGAALVTFAGCRLGAEALIGAEGKAAAVLDRALDRGRAVLAAEMLGSAQAAFDATIDYLRTRVQFDKPIGAFQALQHRAAELLAELELTRSAVRAALAAIDAGDADEARLASLAKALAGRTLRKVAQEMVQMHGGIGMTDEHDAGLYLKRAQAADMTWGNAAFHRDRYARLSGF